MSLARSVRYGFIISETSMEKITKIAESCVRESADDYVGLWQISTRVRRELGLLTNEKVKQFSIDVVNLIIIHGLCPGDYLKAGFHFWDVEDTSSIIARIDREWDPAHGDPTLANPICWFGVK
jgi:hypothetical protein